MRSLKVLAAALLVFGLSGGSASAVTISLNDTFTANGALSQGAPADPATVTFSVNFDNTNYINNSMAITASTNFPVDGSIEFTYNPFNDLLGIGGSDGADGVLSVSAGTNDFELIIADVSTSPIFADFGDVTSANDGSGYFYSTDTLTANVAEPASLALLAAGLGGVALVRRKRVR